MTFNPSKVPTAGKIPQTVYSLLIHKAEFATSQQGSPGIKLHVEIVAPEAVEENGLTYNTIGTKGIMGFWFTEKNMSNCVEALAKLDIVSPDKEFATVEEYVRWAADELATRVGYSFKSIVASTQEAVLGADRKPLVDRDGKPLLKSHRADFAMFGTIGVMTEPGAPMPF